MRYFLCVISGSLSQRLRSVKFWLVLLLIPALILGLGSLAGKEPPAHVTVGVALPESGAEALWALLSEHNDGILSFVTADADSIDRNVAAGKWDCGLILPEDFRERLERDELDKSITLRIGPGSAAYPIVQEVVSAYLAQLVSPAIAREYLQQSGIAYSERELEKRQESIAAQTRQVGIAIKTLDGAPLQAPEMLRQGTGRLFRWLLCAVMMVRMLFAAVDLAKLAGSAAAKRFLPLRAGVSMLLAHSCADGLLTVLCGCVAAALLGGGVWGIFAVAAYVLLWIPVSVLLAQFRWSSEFLPVWLPFASALSLLLSSALVDVSLLFPNLSALFQYLPCALFLRVWGADTAALAALLGECLLWVVCLCLFGIVFRKSDEK